MSPNVIKTEHSDPRNISASFIVNSASDVVNMSAVITFGLRRNPHKVYIQTLEFCQ